MPARTPVKNYPLVGVAPLRAATIPGLPRFRDFRLSSFPVKLSPNPGVTKESRPQPPNN